ncbi:hypothetical protein SAMN02745119_02359 [Trichlorobacter thiogenes]|uniref:Uncharacterized protein n=1 Tax=Trichlorobacter thiogenes TaxID=115783 RepID=A0A1T4QEH7_9BACT|nr:hypothetical protein [Trichlorobacter thiogenes]SKA02046.1 hypothetical protein SAMN02745119_02359 [Trichlorobacter thiogenes]
MLKHASVIISMITATLYTLGLTFHQGYLREFGINDSLFPLSIDQTIFQGFVSLSTMGASAVVWFFVAAELVLVTALIGEFIINRVNKIRQVTPSNFTSDKSESNINEGIYDINKFSGFSYRMLILATALLVLFIGILFALIASDKSGKEAALRFKENAASDKLFKSTILLKAGNKSTDGYIITSSQNQVAYFAGNETTILNNSDISSIRSSTRK